MEALSVPDDGSSSLIPPLCLLIRSTEGLNDAGMVNWIWSVSMAPLCFSRVSDEYAIMSSVDVFSLCTVCRESQLLQNGVRTADGELYFSVEERSIGGRFKGVRMVDGELRFTAKEMNSGDRFLGRGQRLAVKKYSQTTVS
ncbi:hypothetical protein KSP40_PGU019217 [Platanthera guangdongensis]|uniref:Uncharacterized protein n=1 Tax=Platanthera guangdongensis TaxID=2320717 RepID=A0ABR2MBH9_9ASPA